MTSPVEILVERATSITVFLILGTALTALFLGYDWFWVIFVVGFAAVLPLVSILTGGHGNDEADEEHERAGDRQRHDTNRTHEDPLVVLRDRYARGELTEEQFERKVEALLETETPEAARERIERRARESRSRECEDELEGKGNPNLDR